jgi:hypothetical protein
MMRSVNEIDFGASRYGRHVWKYGCNVLIGTTVFIEPGTVNEELREAEQLFCFILSYRQRV